MMKTRRNASQQGFVAIFLLVAVLVSASSYFAIRIWGGGSSGSLQEQRQQAAFKLAKEALLAYVVANGRFPCPAKVDGADIGTKEAWPDCSETGVSQIGLLPWRYLNLDPTSNPELCLWYAVSGHMIKTTTWAYPVNNDSHGAFRVVDANGNILQGDTLGTNATVVLIAANAPITSAGVAQDRSYTGIANTNQCQLSSGATVADVAKQYLDTATVKIGASNIVIKNWLLPTTEIDPHKILYPQTTATTFVQGYVSSIYPNKELNDHLAWVSVEEFSRAISQHAANSATLALSRFFQPSSTSTDDKLGNKFYPYAANAPDGTCVTGLFAGNLPKDCDLNNGTKSWTEYKTNSPATDPTLKHLINDEWDKRLWYQLSSKCQLGTTLTLNCAGNGDFLPPAGGLTDLHTSVFVAPRGAALPYTGTPTPVARAYTR